MSIICQRLLARRGTLCWMLVFCLVSAGFLGSLPDPSLAAPETAPATQSYPGEASGFTRLTSADGLSQNSVLAILSDSRGFMWFGTRDGLNRYDGYEFRIYLPDPDDPYSLSDNTITALAEDASGALWVGTGSGGLNRLDPQSGYFTHYRHDPQDPSSLGSNYILSLAVDPWGQVWVGTAGGGLDRFDANQNRFIHYRNDPQQSSSLGSNIVNALYIDPEGRVWVATEGGGLNALVPGPNGSYADPQQASFIQYRSQAGNLNSLSDNTVYAICPDGADGVWLSTGSGNLDQLDLLSERVTRYELPSRDPTLPSTNMVRTISLADDSSVWLGTDQEGLLLFDPQSGRFTSHRYNRVDQGSPSSDHIRALLLDQRNILWVGTDGGGLNVRIPVPAHFTHYQSLTSGSLHLSDGAVLALAAGIKGGFWVGTANGGLNFLDPISGKSSLYRHDPQDSDSLASDQVASLYLERDQVLWVGFQGGGVDRLDLTTESLQHFQPGPTDPTSLSPGKVSAILADTDGQLWVGTNGNGISILDPDRGLFSHYRFQPENPGSLSSDTVRAMLEDRNGDIWVATDAGLSKWDRSSKQFVRYRHDPDRLSSLGDDDVLTLYEDLSGRLWVGTNGSGLDCFLQENEVFEHYRSREGLPNQVVGSILEDTQGRLWLGTQGGLARFNPETQTFKNYDLFDGLPVNEFNANAASVALDGELYYGSMNGVVAFYPERLRTDQSIPPVVITSLTQGGAPLALQRPIEAIKDVTLRWPNNYFEFEYAALSYIQPGKNQYAYVLEGFDTWNYVGEQRFGRYTNLPGGRYTLRVKGTNHDGVWNESGAAVEIQVIPPIWQQRWFLLVTGSIIGLVVLGGYRLRVQAIETRNRELENLVRQRTAEIERRRQIAEGLREILLLLNSEHSLAESVEVILHRAIQFSGAASGWLYHLTGDAPELLAIEKAPGSEEEVGAEVSKQLTAWLVPRLQGNQPVTITDLAALPPVDRTWNADLLKGALLGVPVWVSGEPYGGLVLYYLETRQFTPEDRELAHLLAEQAALAIGNAELRERVKEVAVAGERNRLARDLHDAVTQTLFSASLIAEALPELWVSDPQEGMVLLQEMRQLSRGALAEMRTLLLELRPAAVCEAHLDDLLRQLAESASGRMGVRVEFDIDDRVQLPEEVHLGVYRIAQEALNNVVKHARASRVWLCLSNRLDDPPGRVALEVCDDGRGYDPAAIPRDHHGVKIMRERALAIGASLEIDTAPGSGTRVRLVWPAEDEPAEASDSTWLKPGSG